MKKIIVVIVLSLILVASACQDRPAEAQTVPETENERILVQTRQLAPERFVHKVSVNGSVEAVLEAFVSPETNGQIKAIHVREGQRVNKGQLLVSLNSDAIRSGIAEVRSALLLAQTVYERRQGLWEKKIGSEIQVLEAKANKESLENHLQSLQAQLDMAEIRAPFTGIVDKIDRKEGELAMPGLELLQLVNLSRMRINAELAESYLDRVKAGDAVEVTFPTYPDRKMSASIQRISNSVNPKNRTVVVQVEFDNPDESIKPNMMAALSFNDFSSEQALTVPAIVVKDDLQGRFVYVLEAQGEQALARKTYIKTGLTEQGQTMVTSGLNPGQQVIVVGYNQISNGSAVRAQN